MGHFSLFDKVRQAIKLMKRTCGIARTARNARSLVGEQQIVQCNVSKCQLCSNNTQHSPAPQLSTMSTIGDRIAVNDPQLNCICKVINNLLINRKCTSQYKRLPFMTSCIQHQVWAGSELTSAWTLRPGVFF